MIRPASLGSPVSVLVRLAPPSSRVRFLPPSVSACFAACLDGLVKPYPLQPISRPLAAVKGVKHTRVRLARWRARWRPC